MDDLKEKRMKLLQMQIEENPEDPFGYYALALEWKGRGGALQAATFFSTVLTRFPDYLPVYYQAADFFAESGEIEKAKELYEKGITLAEATGQAKTLHELKSAFQNFCFEHDLF